MKNFQKWHIQKDKLHKSKRKIYFRERQIWWCSFGLNIGFEQDGKNNRFERPALILKKFNPYVLWILPMTSIAKSGKYYYQFEHNNRKYSIILSQLRLISSKRLLRKIRTFPGDEFKRVRELIKNFL